MSSKKTTENDVPAQKLATKAEADAFNLDPRIVNLLFSEPFFAHVIRGLTRVREEKISTAGVSSINGDPTLYWNPYFVAALSELEIKGLLKHESMHLIYEHCTTRSLKPHMVANYAMDLAINSDIPENELPSGGLYPGRAFPALTAEQKKRMGPERVAAYGRISAKIGGFPKSKSTEWYFAELMSDPEIQKDIEKCQGRGGKSLGQALKDGDVKIDENGNLVDKDGNPVDLVPGDGDDHDGWGEMSDEEKDLLKGKIRDVLAQAAKRADESSNGWGSISAEMRQKIRELVAGEVDWRAVLKQFCGYSRRADRASNVKRLNRKYPGIHPGSQRGYTSSIAVYVDQSGSVSDEALSLLFSEMASLAKRTEFQLYVFDTSVDEKSKQTWKKNRIPDLVRTRCGGTDFQAPSDHADKLHAMGMIDAFIVASDGECSKPTPSRCKRAYVIVPGSKIHFVPDQKDILIQMKGDKAK